MYAPGGGGGQFRLSLPHPKSYHTPPKSYHTPHLSQPPHSHIHECSWSSQPYRKHKLDTASQTPAWKSSRKKQRGDVRGAMPCPAPHRWPPPPWVQGDSACPVLPARLAQPASESVPWRPPPHPAVYKHPKHLSRPAQGPIGAWVHRATEQGGLEAGF